MRLVVVHRKDPWLFPDLHHPTRWLRLIVSNLKRLLVLLVGVCILGAGLAMLVLPGPGILVIVVGLAVLATEFAWAERTLDRTRSRAAEASTKLTASRTGRALFALSAAGLVLGGGVVVVLSDGHRLAGATTVAAGLCALVVLVPATRRWIDRPHDPPSACAASSTLTATGAHGPTPPTAHVPPEATWSRWEAAPAPTDADGPAAGEIR